MFYNKKKKKKMKFGGYLICNSFYGYCFTVIIYKNALRAKQRLTG